MKCVRCLEHGGPPDDADVIYNGFSLCLLHVVDEARRIAARVEAMKRRDLA
jgi:hypothetical protein